jgi:hypothetical protein
VRARETSDAGDMLHHLASPDSTAIQQAAAIVWWIVVIVGAAWCDLKVWKAKIIAARVAG